MNTTGLPELWRDALGFLSHQGTFAQIMIVTLAALFVVMALEGFRASIRSILQGHRMPGGSPSREAPTSLAAPAAFAPRSRGFSAKPRALRAKGLDQSPRQFRSPRPTIKRSTAFVLENRAPQSNEAAVSSPAGSGP